MRTKGPVPTASVARTLFGDRVHDMGAFNADAPLVHEPGTDWAYSTGTSLLIASIAGRAIGSTREATRTYMGRELFDPLGMKSAIPEFDGAGSFSPQLRSGDRGFGSWLAGAGCPPIRPRANQHALGS